MKGFDVHASPLPIALGSDSAENNLKVNSEARHTSIDSSDPVQAFGQTLIDCRNSCWILR